jgi:hypothetical protein
MPDNYDKKRGKETNSRGQIQPENSNPGWVAGIRTIDDNGKYAERFD